MKLTLNKPQARFMSEKPKEAISVWGRGTGKSFLIGLLIFIIIKHMPRCTALIVGSTFKQMLNITLPSTIFALEMLGLYKDKHYFVGKEPPTSWNWPKPIMQSAKGYHNCLYFYTGNVFRLVSQDKNSTSIRGFNSDIIITDEALMLDKKHFDNEVSPTNRGNLDQFGDIPYHHGVFHFSSMPIGSEGEWLTDSANYYLDDGYDFRKLTNNIIELQLAIVDSLNIKERMEAWKEMAVLFKLLKFYKSRQGFMYSESNIFDNLTVLGFDYIYKERKRITDINQYCRELLNKLISKIEGGFYLTFNKDKHCYRDSMDYSNIGDLDKYNFKAQKSDDSTMDGKLVKSLPLYAGIDWGGKINFMVIGQKLSSIKRMNIDNNLYVKSPLIIDDLAEKFATYYLKYPKKILYLYYDNTGNNRQPNSKLTYAQQFKAKLKKAGWTVHLKSKGNNNPEHDRKFLLLGRIFDEKDFKYPIVRINLNNCRELVVGMESAPVKDIRGQIGKNKSSEQNDSLPQEYATHGTDAFDSLIYGVYKSELFTSQAHIPLTPSTRNLGR